MVHPKATLTPRQRSVLDYIRESIRERGYPPTFREIGKRFGITSTNGVNDHLVALERKGHLRRDDMKSRALIPIGPPEPDDRASDLLDIPLLGDVAAGKPIEAIERSGTCLRIDRSLVGRRGAGTELFALRVTGDSMRGAGILDRDVVFARKQEVAERGDIVIASVGNEVTCKFYVPGSTTVVLEPANPKFEPIVLSGNEGDVRILGVVIGVYRSLLL